MEQETVVENILLSDIFIDGNFNCRGEIRPTDITDLIRSIEENGLLQPIIVTPLSLEEQAETGCKYKVIAGFCRTTAFLILGKEKIPAIVRVSISEQTARIINLSENLARKNLNILQESKALEPLRKLGMTEMDIVKAIPGASRGWVQVRVMLLKLPTPVQEEARMGSITQTNIRDLITLKNNGGSDSDIIEQVKKIKDAKAKGDSVPVAAVVKRQTADKAKRQRKKTEIWDMMDHIRTNVGVNFGSRCLAWAAGEISDKDLFDDIKIIANEMGCEYLVSEEALESR